MDARWEGDERGHGIAGAPELALEVDKLATRMRMDDWVTEDASAHLTHHLIRACERSGSGMILLEIREDGTVLVVRVRLTRSETFQDVRGAAMSLVGHVLEGATFVRERRSGDDVTFDVATGMMPGEGGFAGHGHLLRIHVLDVEHRPRCIPGAGRHRMRPSAVAQRTGGRTDETDRGRGRCGCVALSSALADSGDPDPSIGRSIRAEA